MPLARKGCSLHIQKCFVHIDKLQDVLSAPNVKSARNPPFGLQNLCPLLCRLDLQTASGILGHGLHLDISI